MKLDIFCLIFLGYSIGHTQSEGHEGKHVHVRIHVPVPIHNHKHTHTIIKQPEKKIVIHKHQHNHGHGHDHGHKHGHQHKHGHHHDHKHGHNHKHGHHHGHKHKHDHYHKHKGGHHGHHHGHHYGHGHDDWSKYSNVGNYDGKDSFKPSLPLEIDSYGIVPTYNNINFGPYPENNYDDDDYHSSHKSLRSESFHLTEGTNSGASNPVGKHFISGSYKIDETDPADGLRTRLGKIFQAPLANISLQESNHGPTTSASEDESEGEYNDSEEYDDGEEGGDNSEDYNYSETNDQIERSKAPNNYYNVFGVEPLKQFFQNKIE